MEESKSVNSESKLKRLMYITLPLLLKQIQCEAHLNGCNSREIAYEIEKVVEIETVANVLALTGLQIRKENKC